jgi:hypothetical protein
VLPETAKEVGSVRPVMKDWLIVAPVIALKALTELLYSLAT